MKTSNLAAIALVLIVSHNGNEAKKTSEKATKEPQGKWGTAGARISCAEIIL